MALVNRQARYQGTIQVPLRRLPYAVPAGGTYDLQPATLQARSMYPANGTWGYNGGVSMQAMFTTRTIGLVGGRSFLYTPTSLENYTPSPNNAPTGAFESDALCYGDKFVLLSHYTNNGTVAVTTARENPCKTKAIQYFPTPGGGAVSTPVGLSMNYADRFDAFAKRPILFYANSSLHVGNYLRAAVIGRNGVGWINAIPVIDITEPAMAQSTSLVQCGFYGINYLLSSRAPTLKPYVSLTPWVVDPQITAPLSTQVGNSYVITLDNPTLNAVMLNSDISLWRFGNWFGGFLLTLRTAGTGPTGQQCEALLFDPECLKYWLIKFIPQDAQATAALARVNATWSFKIGMDGLLYWRSMSGTDNALAFIGAFPPGIIGVTQPPLSLPCYIPCDPTYYGG